MSATVGKELVMSRSRRHAQETRGDGIHRGLRQLNNQFRQGIHSEKVTLCNRSHIKCIVSSGLHKTGSASRSRLHRDRKYPSVNKKHEQPTKYPINPEWDLHLFTAEKAYLQSSFRWLELNDAFESYLVAENLTVSTMIDEEYACV